MPVTGGTAIISLGEILIITETGAGTITTGYPETIPVGMLIITEVVSAGMIIRIRAEIPIIRTGRWKGVVLTGMKIITPVDGRRTEGLTIPLPIPDLPLTPAGAGPNVIRIQEQITTGLNEGIWIIIPGASISLNSNLSNSREWKDRSSNRGWNAHSNNPSNATLKEEAMMAVVAADKEMAAAITEEAMAVVGEDSEFQYSHITKRPC